MEDGGDTDDAIAGVLHDVLEDCNQDGNRPAEIESQFGADVLAIVNACTGPTKHEPGMSEFRIRKQVYLDRLRAERDGRAVRVSLADKVHNARSTVYDLANHGPKIFQRFNAGADDQLWWYDNLAETYEAHAREGRADPRRARGLAQLVARMHELTLGT